MPTTPIPIPSPAPAPNIPAQPAPGTVGVLNGHIVIYTGTLWASLGPIDEEANMTKFQVAYKSHNVNTKRVLNELTKEIDDVVSGFIYYRSGLHNTYDYSQFVDYLDMILAQMVEDGEITTFDVDHRNNDSDDVRKGNILVTVKFKQFNCLNTTVVNLYISKA